jgi:hypothetical protein
MVPYISLGTGVPRALYIRFPFGDPFGLPGDADTQRQVLHTSLQWLHDAPGPNELYRIKVNWRRKRTGSE